MENFEYSFVACTKKPCGVYKYKRERTVPPRKYFALLVLRFARHTIRHGRHYRPNNKRRRSPWHTIHPDNPFGDNCSPLGRTPHVTFFSLCVVECSLMRDTHTRTVLRVTSDLFAYRFRVSGGALSLCVCSVCACVVDCVDCCVQQINWLIIFPTRRQQSVHK